MTRAFLLFVAAVAISSCGVVQNAVDCQSICNRYKTCFDANYDVGACADRCRTDSNNNPDYEAESKACSDCIDDKSCASSTFTCATSCGTIVP
jgi:hypothetical protein